jgi:hypothetical protein
MTLREVQKSANMREKRERVSGGSQKLEKTILKPSFGIWIKLRNAAESWVGLLDEE